MTEEYFTITEWRGIPEGRVIFAHGNDATGLVEVTEPVSKVIIHSCMVEIIAGIRMGILVDIKTEDFETTESDD